MTWPLKSAGSSRCACVSAMPESLPCPGDTRMRAHCADQRSLTTPRSGQMSGDRQGRRRCQRLVDDAVALGQTQQRLQLLVTGVGVEVEVGANRCKSDRCLLVDAKRAAKVQVPLDVHRAPAKL